MILYEMLAKLASQDLRSATEELYHFFRHASAEFFLQL